MRIVNKKKFIKATTTLIVGLVLSITMILTLINFCKYPEEYLTTWKYQLKHKIAEGDQTAIEYYQKVYIDNGKTLWE